MDRSTGRWLGIALVAVVCGGLLAWHTTTDEPDILLVGDSILRQSGPGLAQAATGYEVRNRAVNGSGVLNPDDYDWEHLLPDQLRRYWPQVVVVLFIGNYGNADYRWHDDQGRPVDRNSPAFFEHWREQADHLLDIVERESDAEIYLVLPPPMLPPPYRQTAEGLRQVYADLAESRDDVTLIDANQALAGPGGEYLAEAPGPDGRPVPLRREDGVHLHDEGVVRLGAEIARVIQA